MAPDKPIYHKEGEELKETINHLIGRHNILCTIEEEFIKNKTANEYFKKARDEVLESGNQSVASMFGIAIENMAEYITDCQDDISTDKLQSRIYSLESENRKLKMRLENIIRAVNLEG